jgi:heme/copper-type cytochrome/quinol oxidase subunit 4
MCGLLAKKANFGHSGWMDTASFLDTFIAVICANGVTALLISFFLRMKRRDDDHWANFGFLAVLAFIGLVLYASTPS